MYNKQIIKAGIIGSGFAADFHYEALKMEIFYNAIAYGSSIESITQLVADVINIIYTAYLSAENEGKLIPIDLNYL